MIKKNELKSVVQTVSSGTKICSTDVFLSWLNSVDKKSKFQINFSENVFTICRTIVKPM